MKKIIGMFYNSGFKTVKVAEHVDASSFELTAEVGKSVKRVKVSRETLESFLKGRALFVEEFSYNGLQNLSVRCSKIPNQDVEEYQLRIVEPDAEF